MGVVSFKTSRSNIYNGKNEESVDKMIDVVRKVSGEA